MPSVLSTNNKGTTYLHGDVVCRYVANPSTLDLFVRLVLDLGVLAIYNPPVLLNLESSITKCDCSLKITLFLQSRLHKC